MFHHVARRRDVLRAGRVILQWATSRVRRVVLAVARRHHARHRRGRQRRAGRLNQIRRRRRRRRRLSVEQVAVVRDVDRSVVLFVLGVTVGHGSCRSARLAIGRRILAGWL